MGILGKLFGSDKVVEKATEGIFSGIDKAILTKEEQLDYNLLMLKAYEPFKIAQRLLALTFAVPYAIAWFTLFIVILFTEIKVSDAVALLDGKMGQIVLAIMAFYFLGGVANGLTSIKKKT